LFEPGQALTPGAADEPVAVERGRERQRQPAASVECPLNRRVQVVALQVKNREPFLLPLPVEPDAIPVCLPRDLDKIFGVPAADCLPLAGRFEALGRVLAARLRDPLPAPAAPSSAPDKRGLAPTAHKLQRLRPVTA